MSLQSQENALDEQLSLLRMDNNLAQRPGWFETFVQANKLPGSRLQNKK